MSFFNIVGVLVECVWVLLGITFLMQTNLLGLETNFKWIWQILNIFVNLVFKKSGLFWEERVVMNQLKRLISENAPVTLCSYPVIPYHGLPALFSMLIRNAVSTNCKPHLRDSSSNLVWVTQEVLIRGSCPDLSTVGWPQTCGAHIMCVFQRHCVFSPSCWELLIGACSQMASQQLLLKQLSCAHVARDHIVWSKMEGSHKGILGQKMSIQGFNWVV